MKRLLTVAAAPLFLLTACSGGESSSSPSTVTKTVTSSASSAPVTSAGAAASSSSSSTATPQAPSSAATETSSTASPAGRPNPVDLLRKIPGCVVQDNAKVGSADMDGNLYASCIHGGATVAGDGPTNSVDITIRTNVTTPQPLGQVEPDDNFQIAYGPTWVAEMRPLFGNGTWSITADKVASLLGGKVVPAGGIDVSE